MSMFVRIKDVWLFSKCRCLNQVIDFRENQLVLQRNCLTDLLAIKSLIRELEVENDDEKELDVIDYRVVGLV